MTKPKKTVKLSQIVISFNNQLTNDTISQESKKDLCLLLERILLDSNCYRGFQYYEWVEHGFFDWIKAGKPNDKSGYLGPEYSRIYF